MRLVDPLWLVFEPAWNVALHDQARVAHLDGLTGGQDAWGLTRSTSTRANAKPQSADETPHLGDWRTNSQRASRRPRRG